VKTAEEIAADIRSLLPDVRGGSLCFFGEWFGRPRDNCHQVTAATAEGDALVVRFNEQERLTVLQPEGVRVSADEFRIENAAGVRWEWCYHGRPQLPENLYSIEYSRKGNRVEVTDTTDWHHSEHHPDPTAPAA